MQPASTGCSRRSTSSSLSPLSSVSTRGSIFCPVAGPGQASADKMKVVANLPLQSIVCFTMVRLRIFCFSYATVFDCIRACENEQRKTS